MIFSSTSCKSEQPAASSQQPVAKAWVVWWRAHSHCHDVTSRGHLQTWGSCRFAVLCPLGDVVRMGALGGHAGVWTASHAGCRVETGRTDLDLSGEASLLTTNMAPMHLGRRARRLAGTPHAVKIVPNAYMYISPMPPPPSFLLPWQPKQRVLGDLERPSCHNGVGCCCG